MAEFTVAGLRIVQEVARSGSFTATAELLGYTQSAVSRQVALMEQAAGHPLFERHSRGVLLTQAGEILLRHASSLLVGLEAVHQELEAQTLGPRGLVRMGAFSTALAALVPAAIASYAREDPTTRVVLREGSSRRLTANAVDGRVHLAVVTPLPEMPEELGVESLLQDPLLVAMPRDHHLAGRPTVSTDELRDEKWIAASTDPRSMTLGAWSGSRWRPDIAYVARDWNAKLGLVGAGLGITVVPGLVVATLPPTIAVARIDDPRATRTTAMVMSSSSPPDPRRDGLCEALRVAAADLTTRIRGQLRA